MLFLLHAALGAASQFDSLASQLGGRVDFHRFDFEGHGRDSRSARPFRIEHFIENTLGELAKLDIERADFFGYSMGGYVATVLALNEPERVGRIMTLGTKWRWDAETAMRESRLLDPARMREKVPAFARMLEERHSGCGLESVLVRTSEMMHALGASAPLDDERLAAIPHRVRIAVGDRDATVTVEESTAIYRALPNAELQVLPATPHPIEKVGMKGLAEEIVAYFASQV